MKRAAIILLAACSGQAAAPPAPPAPPEPVAKAPKQRAELACRDLSARPVSVNIAAGYTAADVAAWLVAWSCRTVVVPEHARERTASAGISELVDGDDLPRVLDQLLSGLDLVAVTEGRFTVFIDADERLESESPQVVWTPDAPAGETPATPATDGDAAISSLGKHRYRLTRETLENALIDPGSLGEQVRVVPAIKDGEPDGFKLYAIRPSSLLARLGFKNGDTIHRINGRDMSTPDQALEVYNGLRDADRIRVELTRRGKPIELVYEIH